MAIRCTGALLLTTAIAAFVFSGCSDAGSGAGDASSGDKDSGSASDDTVPPTVNGSSLAASVNGTDVTITWDLATDNVTPAEEIEYGAVAIPREDVIPDVQAMIDNPPESTVVFKWAKNISTATISGLDPNTKYTVGVAARDAALNNAPFGKKNVTTGEAVIVPTAGSAITFSAITSTSFTASWGVASDASVTDATKLEYRVVRADTVDGLDELAEAEAATDVLLDWTANATTIDVTGLSEMTSVAIAVIVRNPSGKTALYEPQLATTLDGTAPTVGTGIVISGVTTGGATATFGAASDNSGSVEYRVVRAADVGDIDTVDEAEAITGAAVVRDWSSDASAATMTGLAGATAYAVTVLVRDAAGNMAVYTPVGFTTPSAVTPGTDIAFSLFGSKGYRMTWGAATHATIGGPTFEYKLVRATSAAAIDSVAEADATSFPLFNWTANKLTYDFELGFPGTTTYFALLVREASAPADMALYTVANETNGPVKKIFMTDATTDGDIGGYAFADAICASDVNNPGSGTYKALLVGGGRTACTTAYCSGGASEHTQWVLIPFTSYRRSYQTSTSIFSTTANGVPTSVDNGFDNQVMVHVWTGLTNDWQTSSDTCSDWADSSTGNGVYGFSHSMGSSGIAGGNEACSTSNHLYCVEQ